MTIDALPMPTSGELRSLVDLAVATPGPKRPALHLSRLVMLGYVLIGPDGPIVTGDGLDHRKRVNKSPADIAWPVWLRLTLGLTL